MQQPLTLDELKARQEVLKTQTSSAQADYEKILAKIQKEGQQITGSKSEKYGGFLGAFQKTKVTTLYGGVSNEDYDALEKLYTTGQLDEKTKSWFEELKKVKDEMGDISDEAAAAADQMAKLATGTTADQIASTLLDGFRQGFRSFDDFAKSSTGNFADMIRGAIESGFSENYLKTKIADFYKKFAAASEAGLDDAGIAALKAEYAKLINDAGIAYDNSLKVIGANGTPAKASANTLVGNVATITQDQASIIGGSLARQGVLTQQLVDLSKPLPAGQQEQLSELRTITLTLLRIERHVERTADATEKALEKLDKIGQTDADQLAIAVRGAGFWKY